MAIRELRLFFTVPGWWCFDNNSGVSFNIRLKAAAVGATRSLVHRSEAAMKRPHSLSKTCFLNARREQKIGRRVICVGVCMSQDDNFFLDKTVIEDH